MRSAALAVGLLLSLPFVARAQRSEPKRLEAGAFVGSLSLTQSLGTSSSIYTTVDGAAQSVDFGKLYGGRASWAFARYIVAEFDFWRSTNAYTLSVDDREVGSLDLGEQFDAEQLYFGGSVVVQYPLEWGLVPYGTFGVGRLRTKPMSPIEGIEQVDATDVTVGGGVKYWIPAVRWLGLGLDLRYHSANKGLTFPGGDSKPNGTELTVGGFVRLF